jgi:hypothetical protein
MPSSPPSSAHVLRPPSAVVAAVVWALVTVGWCWLALRDGGPVLLARQLPAMTLACTVVYVVLVRPSVTVGPAGIRLRNVLSDVDVPWPALERVSTRFALTLHTVGGQELRAWAAPASGRHVDTRLTAGDVRALGWDDDVPPTASASSASSSGVAAAWVRREWRRALAEGSATDVAPVVRRRTARGPAVWLAASAALTVATLVL